MHVVIYSQKKVFLQVKDRGSDLSTRTNNTVRHQRVSICLLLSDHKHLSLCRKLNQSEDSLQLFYLNFIQTDSRQISRIIQRAGCLTSTSDDSFIFAREPKTPLLRRTVITLPFTLSLSFLLFSPHRK